MSSYVTSYEEVSYYAFLDRDEAKDYRRRRPPWTLGLKACLFVAVRDGA